MNIKTSIAIGLLILLLCSNCTNDNKTNQPESTAILAERPPMGWNSWICFGTSVTEDEVKANADFMAENLKKYGWEYIVIDAGWYAPGMETLEQYESSTPHQIIDKFGRLIVDTEKFPSAKNGEGLKPLADYLHSRGLKLGIHIMRGIPIQAVEANTPIKGTSYRARDIVNTDSRCKWYFGFYGIDMSKPGAQEYYDSLFELYDSWGIDYVKADDLLSPIYAHDEIEAITKAARKRKRPFVLSLSPGPAPVENIKHLQSVAQLWRISEDFWDDWEALKEQFPLCRKWQKYICKGHWPDADMLPIGYIKQDYSPDITTLFTKDEQVTMLTLWSIFRSPLIIGGEMTKFDDFTMSLLTNEGILKMHRNARHSHQVWRRKMNGSEIVLWTAADAEGGQYAALFNIGENAADISVPLTELEIYEAKDITELWSNEAFHADNISADLAPHSAKAYYLSR